MRQPAVDFKELKLDALIISGVENVRYLSGYTGSNGLLLLAREAEPVFFTDTRYALSAQSEVDCRIEIVSSGPLRKAASKWIKRKRFKRVGFERTHLSYDSYLAFDENLAGARLLPVGTLIEQQRMVKDEAELGSIRKAVATNSAAFDRAVKRIKAGVRESEIAAELDYQMRKLGAEKPAFDTIVAAGVRTALPHARPTSARLGQNELVLIDVGAFQEGYASDMTRVLQLGVVSAALKQMYGAVLEAQLAAIDAVRDGVTAESVDAAARKVLARHGLDKQFTHSTGHGLGLEIHEQPRLGRRDKTKLRAGMAITIEPGAYVENLGGIRIEDTLIVTGNGCEVLTPTPKELTKL